MYWLLLYDYVDDMAERRAPFREAHLARVGEAHAAGTLLAAGALVDPLDGAVLLFRGDDRAVVEDFASRDPYVREGLVTRWRARQWTVVVGGPEAP
jgi:uncharacterized protein